MLNPRLYYRTLRHLRGSQILWRIGNKAISSLESTCVLRGLYSKDASIQNPANLTLRNPLRESHPDNEWKGEFRFCFLNREVDTQGNWFPKGVSALWLFNLHYFHFLYGLNKENASKLIISWLDAVPVAHRLAWHPYVTSERLCSWIWTLSPIWNELDEPFKRRVLNSISNQANYLKRHLEYDLLGNHLLVDARGLVISGLFLGNDDLVQRGIEIFQNQLPEQILSDGGHYERSPMYHSLILEDLIMVARALGDSSAELLPYIEKMARFLSTICISDEIPLLNDSVNGIAIIPSILIREAAELCSCTIEPSKGWTALAETGLYVFRGDPFSVIFDAGPIGPDFQPGHGHNDTLQFLVWVDGKPFITDTGVYGYEEGPERAYCRSARAHNVVWVPPDEPNEIWKSFRVGRREGAVSVDFRPTTNQVAAKVKSGERSIRRTINISENGMSLMVEDSLSCRVPLPIEGNVHFSPAVTMPRGSRIFEGACLLESGENTLKVVPNFGAGSQEIIVSPYFSRFGEKEERLTLHYLTTSSLVGLRFDVERLR